MKKRWFEKISWPTPIQNDAAKYAASFQETMQRPRKGCAKLLNAAFVVFVAVLPLVTVLGVNLSVCHAGFQGSLENSKLSEVCSPKHPKGIKIDTARSDQLAAELETHRSDALTRLGDMSFNSPSEAVDWLEAVEHVIALQIESIAVQEAEASRSYDNESTKQYKHYRAVVIFMSLGVVYAAWALTTFAAQGWVANRLWVVRERKKDGEWEFCDVLKATPLWSSLIFAALFALVLIVFDFERLFDLPGILDEDQFPVPWLWIIVATMTVATIFLTATATQRLAHDFPAPTSAHLIRVRLFNHSLEMNEFLNAEIEKKYSDNRPDGWPEKVTHLEVLALGCAAAASAKQPPTRRPTEEIDKLPKVAKTIDPEANLDAIKSLCVFLIALMIATLVFVSFGFNVLEGELVVDEDLKEAIVASGNAWTMVLGMGMSVSVFLIYMSATSRLLPYCDKPETGTAQGFKGWALSGKLGLMPPSADAVSLKAKPMKPETPEPTINRDEAFILGGNQKKLQSIIDGCGNGGGFQASFDQALLKKLVSVVGLLAPAAAGTILTFL